MNAFITFCFMNEIKTAKCKLIEIKNGKVTGIQLFYDENLIEKEAPIKLDVPSLIELILY